MVRVSRILGHARIEFTLDTYTHLFDDDRHNHEIRELPGCRFVYLANGSSNSMPVASTSATLRVTSVRPRTLAVAAKEQARAARRERETNKARQTGFDE